ncbi:hypothetical protein ACAW49_03030 [Pseudomonas sp. Env-44]|uniref:Phage protein n=1 Tax=Pseudomonas synxantha TaxID=47883 RepID=A0AAX3I5B2_9PSED|nr:hypothetical protein [Pseudomonas synxantha]AZE67737.1 hypothetical protein C4K01_3544 [Pseudomonas synxantha]KRP51520.1 hypothetical protein TU77_21290 [Pseudomonas synxantha]SDU19261.1 hypothetical protein SAMN05216475_1604 [Pseudomonas synxantha]VTQ97745.1 Uncharacterised protein [Pseudomonas synxantha]
MNVKILDQAQHRAVRDAKGNLKKAAEFADEFRTILQHQFAKPGAPEAWGVDVEFDSSGLGFKLKTPFGLARAIAVSSIIHGKSQIRYVIEKEVTLEGDVHGHVKVAAICIDEFGVVSAEDDGDKLANLNVIDESQVHREVGEVGVSIVHAIGAEERYFSQQ